MNRNFAFQPVRSTLMWLVAACVLTFAGQVASAADPGNRLEAVDVQTLPGQVVQLTLRTSGPAPEPMAFTIDNPARISLDLPDTALALPSRRVDVNSAGVDTVLAAEASGRTRLVVNLDHMQPYTTRVAGNEIVVTIGAGQGAAATAAVDAPSSGVSAPAMRALRSIDFRRGADGTGRLIVKLTDPRTPINVRQQGDQIVVDFAGADVPKSLIRRYDASDFATPVTGFDVVKVGDGARIVINGSGNYEQLAYQSDDQYVVELQPARKVAAEADAKPVYTGERLTLNFQDIETRAVLQLLADASAQNIVVSDSVSGSVTLRLQNVPWDQALDIVLRTKGLDKRRQDNVIIVAPADELAAREKADLAAKKDIQELAPLRSEYLQVNYAKAGDLAELIKSQGGSLLSERGSVAIDARTNTLLLQDTADKLADIRRLVGTLDIPVRQVLIEARIVVVNDDFTRELGVRAGFTGIDVSNGGTQLGMVSGSAAATDTGLASALDNLANNGVVTPVEIPTGAGAANRYNVNLPVANPAGRLAFMLLGSDYIVDLELSAAQAEGRGEIISSPRVITANQREASIEQGVEIPYQESASSGATTIQFKKAVLSLKVTPQITPDNRIILDLNVKKDSVGAVIVGSGGVNVPSIDTREITTQVLVNDGQTVVLGGILETERRDTEKKVPYLGDIPGLGILFKQKSKTNNKDELLIFVTPKILREGVNVY
ncbi:MAG TPA: type IV pilus secretin PilQ [Steroidobacteraceae bacterium]|nr:type IV pilus secretin PilQ [Steroidobacteraceae bacterium]HQX80017.1 type IV pilus secretin PilQ [Steroidobacteraceae bacterium]HQZ81455.1 type IV pilus secretin PilQ [Steroidobacteraceae bacterium]